MYDKLIKILVNLSYHFQTPCRWNVFGWLCSQNKDRRFISFLVMEQWVITVQLLLPTPPNSSQKSGINKAKKTPELTSAYVYQVPVTTSWSQISEIINIFIYGHNTTLIYQLRVQHWTRFLGESLSCSQEHAPAITLFHANPHLHLVISETVH